MLKLADFVLSTTALLIVFAIIFWSITPVSPINFLGAGAGVATALVAYRSLTALPAFFFCLLGVALVGYSVFDVMLTPELGIIAGLSITLQCMMALQLTVSERLDNDWLASRIKLASFLIKLGPISSLVVAVGVLVLVSVSSEHKQSGLVYTLILSWSLSQLVAVFLLPVLVFLTELPQISRNKRYQVIGASCLAVCALSFLFRVSHNDYQHKRFDDFYFASNEIERAVVDELSEIKLQMSALQAFFQASDNVTVNEFNEFSARLLQTNTVVALQWIPLVSKGEKQNFERVASSSLATSVSIDNPQSLRNYKKQHDYFAPVYYSHSKNSYLSVYGGDLLSDERFALALESAMAGDVISSTAPLAKIVGESAYLDVYLFLPILNKPQLNPFGFVTKENGSQVNGFIAAVIQAEPALSKLAEQSFAKSVTVSFKDMSGNEPFYLFGMTVEPENRLLKTVDFNEFGRQWQLTIAEAQAWLAQPRNWLNWGVLLGCTVGGILYQLLILLMTAYTTELNRKVKDKTHELILQKEQSEQESKGKSALLANLNRELKTPINALNSLITQLRITAQGKEEELELVDNISSVSTSLLQTIEHLHDLSAMEAGGLEFSNQSFDFLLFLKQMEVMLNANREGLARHVGFYFDDSLPRFVLADQQRLQQLIVALTHNSALIFNTDNLAVSVKAHRHQHGSASIFIVITDNSQGDEHNHLPAQIAEREFENLSTSMTIAKEICQQLEGDINLSLVPEAGNYMLSASVKLPLDTNLANTSLKSWPLSIANKEIVIICEDRDIEEQISDLLMKSRCTVRHFNGITDSLMEYLNNSSFDLVFIECCEINCSEARLFDAIAEKQNKTGIKVPIIGISDSELDVGHVHLVDSFIEKPVRTGVLLEVLARYF